ncbi:hypothetical protein [Rosettibacter firmus]|uniref:hypothetical protein n=1 Tax=Rosettibacter firmus TaxID=3111522 RepID=UPI00336C071E
METFKYSFFAKLIYRYGNIIATLMLSLHLISSIYYMNEKFILIIPALINALIIIYLNKYFIMTYKFFPFKIIVDKNKLICSNFFLSKKNVEIEFKNINEITGGIFSGYPTKPIYIHDKSNNQTIGFYTHLKGFQKLLTIILQNIPENLYNELLEKIQKKKKPTKI